MKSLTLKLIVLLSIGMSLLLLNACTHKMAGSGKPVTNESGKESNNDSDIFSRLDPKDQTATQEQLDAPFPPVMVYKTKRDVRDRVPVILSDDRSAVASYPDIKDVYYRGELAYPLALVGGYWMDRRGINVRVAFLDYTYEEYSRLEETPIPEILIYHIYDKDPLRELYSCKCERDTAVINEMIRSGKLKNCQRLK
jgi:hypothetical protein